MNTPENDKLSLEMKKRFKALCQVPIKDQQFSIYRVPLHIRKNNESYYEPRMVSVGPYHRKKQHLRAMEEHKWRYLEEYISEGKGKEHDYIREIREMDASIRACYMESFDMDEDQFAEMMLLDSCFIIQLFIKWRFEDADPVREIGWALPLLIADLIMLENQIPFFVLTKMYNIYQHGSVGTTVNASNKRPSLLKLFTESLYRMYGSSKEENPNIPKDPAGIKHLLHLFYTLFVRGPEIITSTASECPRLQRNDQENGREPPTSHIVELPVERSPRMIPSVTELQEFGVTFKKKKNSNSFLDISFNDDDGVIEIPYILVEESIRSRFLNLIAFEQCRGSDQKHLTSYAVFMDCLINTSKDVIALQKCGIIENKLANAKEAAKFFNQLRDCAYIDYEEHYFKPVFVNVKHYCEAFWPKHRARLIRDYFSSPWTIFSLLAALLVLSITIFRTLCFILSTDLKKLF